MNIRSKLILVILGMMGVYFLITALLLEVEHLKRMQDRKADMRNLLVYALKDRNDRESVSRSLNSLVESGYAARWFVLTSSPDGHALAYGDKTVPATGAFTVAMTIDRNDLPPLRVRVQLRESVMAGLGGDLQALLISTLFGALLLAVSAYLLISRFVLDPVEEMLQATHRLAAGASPQALRLATRSDELGRLATAFDSMAREVQETRTHLEDRVREATRRIEKSQRDLAFADRLAATGRLAAGVAHEINNPLGGVMNAVARLRKDPPPEKRDEYLDLIDDGLGRIREIVKQILDFARKTPETGDVDLALPVKRALDLCRHRADKANVAVQVDGPEAGPVVRADTGELQQVFLNLVTNALDAMPDGGTLTVSVMQGNEVGTVRISDTGAGMTPEELNASFDLFHTTKPAGEGTGLGLAIAYEIVNRYGGVIQLESEPGRGTCAHVRLPLAQPTDNEEETDADSAG